MKKALFVVIGAAVIVTGCKKEQEERATVFYPDAEVVDGVYTMPYYHVCDTDTVGDNIYVYEITREANDSLPMVVDDWGTSKDNTISLTLSRNGHRYYSRTFTKQLFQSSLDTSFYAHSILDGIRFLRTVKGQGMVFSLAISQPNSDMTMAFSVTVADDGNVSFAKEEVMDVDLDDEQAPAY